MSGGFSVQGWGSLSGVSVFRGPCPVGGGPVRETPSFPPVNRITDRCKNITLPQTSFAGGKNP